MQTNDERNSLHSALSSLVYSDLTSQQFHNHAMERNPLPPTYVEEFWSSHSAGKEPFGSFASPQIARASPYPFESPKSVMNSTFEATHCAYEGIPFDPSTRWDVHGAAANQGIQESSIMNEWIMAEERLRFDSMNPGPSRFGNQLSLSLATANPRVVVNEVSELSSSGSLHKRHVGSDNNTSCSSNHLSLNFDSCKGYMSGSRFFQAMQEILAEFACYALESYDRDQHRASFASDRSAELESEHRFLNQSNGMELEAKKKHLLSLLQLVDEQYNQWFDEIHTVISAFHAVTELDPDLHSRFALPTITFMYRNLKERISSQILSMGARQSEEETRDESTLEMSFVQKQWALQQIKKRENQVWRPQRGLPERSVSVLRAWMFQNFLHPYPKDAEKHLLALKSGLTRSQVSNWFINARVRLWKPLIEEMYAEMNRRKALKNQEEGNNGSHLNRLLIESRRFTDD